MQATGEKMQQFAHIADNHRRVFAGMLSSLDDAVGAILTKLRKERLERETLVVFLSDNGGPVQELTSSNAPLRGQEGAALRRRHPHSVYDAVARPPAAGAHLR